MKIEISDHAKEKISILRSHGIKISEEQIKEVVMHPQKILSVWEGRFIAQRDIDRIYSQSSLYERKTK